MKNNTYLFIINLYVTDSDCDGLIKFKTCFVIELLDSSWKYTPLFIVVCETKHRICFSTACLAITHHSTVVSLYYTLNNTRGSLIINIILSCIVKNSWELEFPVVKLIVHRTCIFLVNVDVKILNKSLNMRLNKLWLTPVFGLTFKFCEANPSVGLVLIKT